MLKNTPCNSHTSKTQYVYIYVVLLSLTFLSAFPLYLMFIGGTKNDTEILTNLNLLPSTHLFENLKVINKNIPIWRGFFNSLLITVPFTLLSAYMSSFTAFGFSVYNFRFKKYLFGFVLSTMMIPAQLGIIGYFEFCISVNIIDTYIPLIIGGTVNTFSIFFIKQYSDQTLHKSLIEAARIDEATELQIFHRIALPILAPCIVTVSMFNFVSSWNNFIGPLVLLFSEEKLPLPVIISLLNTAQYPSNLGATYLAVAISLLPIMVVYLFCSKYLISGLTMGAIKE